MNPKTNKYPRLPILTGNNKERVFTKHWSNLPLHLNRNEMALLSFITHQARADNGFRYSGMLIKKYILAVKYANQEYNEGKEGKSRLPNDLSVTVSVVKFWFESLVEGGWIMSGDEKWEFVINPMLTFVPNYVGKGEYGELCEMYQTHPRDVGAKLKAIVKPKIEQKKDKLLYWR